MIKHYDAIIIGAGAAGLMCAITAALRGKSVLVLDHANKAGKKILMSGGGRCNFTNLKVNDQHFTSNNPKFCKSALSRYTPRDFMELVKKYGIAHHEKTLGQLFCDNKSKDILNMLLQECEAAGVDIQLKTTITQIKKNSEQHFLVNTSHGTVHCTSLVIATGGLSIPTMGASPFGYKIAEQFDIKVWPTSAALVPFTLHINDKARFESLSGVSCDCSVRCGKKTFKESMLFTHRGLSGPAMLQISTYWKPGDTLVITLAPTVDVFSHLTTLQKKAPNSLLKNALSDYLPKRLISAFIDEASEQAPLQSLSHKKLQHIAQAFQEWRIKPNATEGYRTAEVTLGGVDCNAVSSKTFESKNTKGLYFIGEVLDVTGWLGGYNFQWAWSSGFAAGSHIG
jgi:predicted Rossmann fold flavoprotein